MLRNIRRTSSRLRQTYFTSDDQLLTLALGVGLDRRLFTIAREIGVRIVSHGVSNNTERTLIELGRAGLMKPGDEYIHCTHLSDDAWRLIKDTGGVVSLAVPIEMAMGHGMPPIQEALDHGMRPSLSSDVDVTMAQDPFTVMRAAFTLQRLNVLQRARRGEQNLPPLLTTRDVLEFATIEGSRCTKLEDKVGTLTPGKEADIVHAGGRPDQCLAAQQCAGRGREPDESDECRHRVHRRQGEEMARQPGRRRRAARAAARPGSA